MGDAKMSTFLPPYIADNPVMISLEQIYRSFVDRRVALGLSNPGSVENISREVQRDVFLSNSMFTGLRADFTRPMSVKPLFQYSHAFAMGSQGLPPYNFSVLFGTPSIFLQGNLDNDGQVSARGNYRWSEALITKAHTQLAPGGSQAMLQLDSDYVGKDFTASIKSINPNFWEGGLTGIFIGSYLQSLTPGLAIGMEAMWQRAAMHMGPEAVMSYCAKYKGLDWILSAQLQAGGALTTSYWRRLTEKVEAGVDLNLTFAPGLGGGGGLVGGGGRGNDGTATVGAKYDFRTSSFRAQLDSTGKLSCLLEKRVLPPVQVTFAGEMDHYKQQAKVGLAVSIEVTPEDVMAQAGNNTGPPSVPF